MPLSNAIKKQYKSIAHHLNPIVIISENGLNEGVLLEIERAIHDHELIKVKFASPERDERAEAIKKVCESVNAELVQVIGKMAILYRKNPKPSPKLSNILRNT